MLNINNAKDAINTKRLEEISLLTKRTISEIISNSDPETLSNIRKEGVSMDTYLDLIDDIIINKLKSKFNL